MTTDEYIAYMLAVTLAATDIHETLGPRALALAVALAAATPRGTSGSTYEYWLRAWRCPGLPGALVRAGWEWEPAGEALVNPRGRLRLAQTGQAGIDAALQVTYGCLGINGKLKPHLTDDERAMLCRAGGWPIDTPAPVVATQDAPRATPRKPAAPAPVIISAYQEQLL